KTLATRTRSFWGTCGGPGHITGDAGPLTSSWGVGESRPQGEGERKGAMTEAEWFASLDIRPMLKCVTALAYDRKLRLCAAACCRRFWDLLGEDARRAVEVGERFADGLATEEERHAAAFPLYRFGDREGPGVPWTHPDVHLRLTLERAVRAVTMRP